MSTAHKLFKLNSESLQLRGDITSNVRKKILLDMKYALIAIFAIMASCSPNSGHAKASKKNVSITLTDTEHGSGGGGTRAIKFDNKPIEFTSDGSFSSSQEIYKLSNPTPTGFTLIYDITITRKPTSKSEKYHGDVNVTYTGPETKVLAPDFTLGVLTE